MKTRPWLRFHLSTSLAVMVVAAFLMLLHFSHPIKSGPVLGRPELVFRCFVGLSALFNTVMIWEGHLRTVDQFGILRGSIRTLGRTIFIFLYFPAVIALSLLAGFGALQACAAVFRTEEIGIIPAIINFIIYRCIWNQTSGVGHALAIGTATPGVAFHFN